MVNTFVHHVARPGPLASACALVLVVFALLIAPRTDDTTVPARGRLHDIELTHHKQETTTP